MTDLLDGIAIGKEEKDSFENANKLRAYVKKQLDERREEMKDPSFKSKGDFMTLLLEDQYFDEETIITECVSFMAAANFT